MQHSRKRKKHTCKGCRERKALFRVHNGRSRHYRASSDHDLCRQCWESQRDRLRAECLGKKRVSEAQVALLRHLAIAERAMEEAGGGSDSVLEEIFHALFPHLEKDVSSSTKAKQEIQTSFRI